MRAVVAQECLQDGEPAPAEAEARPALDPEGWSRLAAELEWAGTRQPAALSLNAKGQLAPAQRAALVRDMMLRLALGVGLLPLAGWLAHELLLARGAWQQVSWALLVVADPYPRYALPKSAVVVNVDPVPLSTEDPSV